MIKRFNMPKADDFVGAESYPEIEAEDGEFVLYEDYISDISDRDKTIEWLRSALRSAAGIIELATGETMQTNGDQS